MDRAAATEWRKGWPIVAAGTFGMTMMALHTAAIGTMVKPLSDAFGWSRFDISAGMTINTILLFIGMPIVAVLLPRLGARRIVISAALLFAAGFVALGLTTAEVWTWYAGWALMGTAQSGISGLIWTTVVTRAFVAARGLALAVALSGSGLATFCVPLIVAYSLGISLKAPFFVLAALTALLILPLIVLFMSGRPEFGAQPLASGTRAGGRTEQRRELREIIGRRQVWQLVVISALTSTAIGLIFAHMQAIIRDAGASATQAAGYFTVIGPTMIVSRLVTGVLLDRLPTRPLAAALLLLPALSTVLLLNYDGSTTIGLLACFIFGLGFGAELDLLAFITAKYFGTRHYPVVYSIVYGVYALGAGLGAMIGGGVYDAFGSYVPILQVLVGAIVLAVLLTLALGREPEAVGRVTVHPDPVAPLPSAG